MASTFGGSLGAPLFSSDKPWVWAMIPVGFVIVVGAVALCLHSQRRRKHFEAGLASSSPNGGTRLDPAGTRALERDLEEAWVRGATPTRRPPARHHRSGSGAPSAAAGRWTRPTSRWQWAGGVARQEEGLNELGEAPPPYEKQGDRESPRKSSSVDGNVSRRNTDDDDSVELQNFTSPPPPAPALTISRATSSPISVYGNEMGENTRIRGNLSAFGQPPPPAYESDGTRSPTPTSAIGSEQRGGLSPRPPSPPIGGYDDGTAIVGVTPVPAAVLPPPEHRSG